MIGEVLVCIWLNSWSSTIYLLVGYWLVFGRICGQLSVSLSDVCFIYVDESICMGCSLFIYW